MECHQQLFILGAPRSGTTFLSRLLEKTRYGKPVETHFITKYHRRLADYGDLTAYRNFRRLLKDILSERAVQQWRLNLDIEAFYETVSPNITFSNIVNELMSLREGRQGTTAWGDKTPHYLGDAERLFELFPDARYIFIVRDGRDVALSLLKKPWGPSNTVSCAEYWARLNSNPSVQERLAGHGQIWFLTYEQLLAEPNQTILALYNFLGESVTDDDLEHLTADTQRQNSNKWREAMTSRQIRQFEALAGDVLTRFGYQRQQPAAHISGLEYVVCKLHNRVSHWYFLFRTNVIDGFRIRFLGKEPFNE